MSNNFKAYQDMGSIIARLPFSICLENINDTNISDEGQYYLRQALHASVLTLIHARQFYQLEEGAVEACADGFAGALTRIFVGTRRENEQPSQMMQVDGDTWELVFDPGPRDDHLRTDEKGRVWRKVEVDIDFNDIPF